MGTMSFQIVGELMRKETMILTLVEMTQIIRIIEEGLITYN